MSKSIDNIRSFIESKTNPVQESQDDYSFLYEMVIDGLFEAWAPKEPSARAMKRMNDAMQRGGWAKMVRATEIRIDAMKDTGKLQGLIMAIEGLQTDLNRVIKRAESKLKEL